MLQTNLEVCAIQAFSDNYIWLLHTGGSDCAVVDPGDHRPVLQALEKLDLNLQYVLVTHHHPDHIGGLPALLEATAAEVFAPHDARIAGPAHRVAGGDRVNLAALGVQFDVIDVPGHTRSHIAFHGAGALFCGDTLFSLGCGRLFEGTPEQMQDSLDRLAQLPADTAVYCAHEYTASNCRFALAVEPDNMRLRRIAMEVTEARAAGRSTLPSTLARELEANPFMRTREKSVVAAARKRAPDAQPGASTMGVIRAWKDAF